LAAHDLNMMSEHAYAAADAWERDRAASYYAGYIDGQGRIKELEGRLSDPLAGREK